MSQRRKIRSDLISISFEITPEALSVAMRSYALLLK